MTKTQKISHKLYRESVEIVFYPASHRYKLVEYEGRPKNEWLTSPSAVSGMLDKSTPLMHWAVESFQGRVLELMEGGHNFTKDDVISMLELGKKSYREKTEQAQNVGSVVHEYAEKDYSFISEIDGFEDLSQEGKEKAVNGAQAYDRWRFENQPLTIDSELMVYSKKHNFVGTADRVAKIKGELVLLDFKTSKKIYPEHILQVSAYAKAYEEMTGSRVSAQIIAFAKEDTVDKDGNVTKPAGSFEIVKLKPAQIVKAYSIFKKLLYVKNRMGSLSKFLSKVK